MAHDQAVDPPVLSAPVVVTTSSSTFRGDIQGLRAIAVVAVALDHANIAFLSGGFVGVDVFFVISGFLITQLLLSEAQRSGRIRLGNFYSRRARRILPAATVVIVSTLAASALLLNYIQTTAIVKDAMWATLFAANVKFSRDETDYFAADDPASPLQHFWSLAVEEQFYLAWPLILACLVAGYALWRRRTGRSQLSGDGSGWVPLRWILIALAAIAAVSLIWSIVLTDAQATRAYFSTFARAWELAAGAACAVLVPRLSRLPIAVRTVTAWMGLAAILTAVVTYSSSTRFPGSAALLPVLGSALLIAGGSGHVRGGPTALLKLAPMQRLGDWSYSFYLWHWPFLLIPAAYVGHDLSVGQNLLLLLVALTVSVGTYRWVENPFRRSPGLNARARRGLLLYPAAVALSLLSALAATAVVHLQVAAAAAAPPVTVDDYDAEETGVPLSRDPAVALVQASAAAARDGKATPGELQPALLDLSHDIPDVGACDYSDTFEGLCERGDVGSDRILVAFGDSHARQWIPALESIATQEGYATYYLVKPGCNSSQLVPDFGHGPAESCLYFRTWALAQIKSLQPDLLVLGNDVPLGAVRSDGERTEDDAELADLFDVGLQTTIQMVAEDVGRTVVMGDPPGMPELPADCLAAGDADLGDCAFPRSSRSRLLLSAGRHAARETQVAFVNPLRWFCDQGLCPAVVGSTVVYRDTEHISATYAAELAVPLKKALARLAH